MSWLHLGKTRLLLHAILLSMVVGGGCGEPRWGQQYPMATFVCDMPLEVNELAVFDASFSRDNGLIESFSFDFGDGSPIVVSFSPRLHHRYREPGSYQVMLEVTDDLGNIAFEERRVVVVERLEPCSGNCAGHLECVSGRCRYTPAQCRSEDSEYGCPSEKVCCHGYCERSCSD